MRHHILTSIIISVLLIACNTGKQKDENCTCYPTNHGNAPLPETYSELKWQDEFNSTTLDTSKWRLEAKNLFNVDYQEKQLFNTNQENISLDNGLLKIQAQKNDSAYTSACLSTREKFKFDNGRLEIRAKMPFGKGILTTFNLKHTNGPENIDIVNYIGLGKNAAGAAIRFANNAGKLRGEGDKHFLKDGLGYSRIFHTFTIIKEKNRIWWYIDDTPFFQIDSTVSVPFPYKFNDYFYLLLNLSVGGVWAGEPDELTYFPQCIEIDYVRYYDRPERISPHSSPENPKSRLSDYKQLTWSDEFDKPQIDTNTWTHDVGDFWYNNEIQAYTSDSSNSFIRNGKLVLQAMHSPAHIKTIRDYTSARLITQGKMDLEYGRIDIRAKMPYGQGIWPAIWMMPTENKYGAWPKSGEIDILEVIGHEMTIVNKACHFGADCERHSRGRPYDAGVDLSKDFHTYSLIKEKDHLWWFFDSIPMMHVSKDLIAPHHYPFNEKFHLILNIAVGGNWPGYPDSTTEFPQTMEVDYVRVYQKVD